jgi:hypothetical protein
VIEEVLRTVGVPLARGQATALASLAFRRLQLRWRGFEFTAQPESRMTHEDLFRIDACWSITVGLAMVDPIRAADFNVRQLLSALGVGDSVPDCARAGARRRFLGADSRRRGTITARAVSARRGSWLEAAASITSVPSRRCGAGSGRL